MYEVYSLVTSYVSCTMCSLLYSFTSAIREISSLTIVHISFALVALTYYTDLNLIEIGGIACAVLSSCSFSRLCIYTTKVYLMWLSMCCLTICLLSNLIFYTRPFVTYFNCVCLFLVNCISLNCAGIVSTVLF